MCVSVYVNSKCLFGYLLSIATVFGHHLSEGLQDLDAQALLVLLQQLLGVLDQSKNTHTHTRTRGNDVPRVCARERDGAYRTRMCFHYSSNRQQELTCR